MPQQGRRFCFTLNNYTDEEEEFIQKTKCTYLVVGREVGDGGTPHLQGYIEFSRKKTLGGVKKRIGSRSHIEFAKGTSNEASQYCKKDGTFFESGQLSGAIDGGRRSGLSEACAIIVSGGSLRDIALTYPTTYVQYRRGLAEYRTVLYGVPRRWKSNTQVYWGIRSGVGKSRVVQEFAGDGAYYFMPSAGGACWFDGYEGQEVAVFDDFDGVQVPFRILLRLLDRYPFRAPIKGASVEWAPRKIYITSNMHPRDWYRNTAGVDVRPLLRRIDGLYQVEQPIYDDISLVAE